MAKGKTDLSFVAIVKNEAPYIIEWLEFHMMVGVEKFYIYDNESNDNLLKYLKPYIEDGIVKYIYFPGTNVQNAAYTDAIRKYKNETKYMGFIDIDEFVVPANGKSITKVVDEELQKDSKAAGLAINWRIYGSNGHEQKPKGLVTENYKYRAKDNLEANKHIKTICNPRRVIEFKNPHFPIYEKGYYSVDEEGYFVKGPFVLDAKCSKIRINHYFTKSKVEFLLKAIKGKADNGSVRPMSDFDRHNKDSQYDYCMEPYIEELKRNIRRITRRIPSYKDQTDEINANDIETLTNILNIMVEKNNYKNAKSMIALARIYDFIKYDVPSVIRLKKVHNIKDLDKH